MADRPTSNDSDPLLAEIVAIAAGLDPKDVEPLDLSDPALLVLVDRAVAPYEAALTPKGLAEAHQMAMFALATHPDIQPVLERVRSKLAQGSSVRPTRSADRLEEVARRRKQTRGSR